MAAAPPGILARGPWDPDRVSTSWRTDPYRLDPDATARADAAVAALSQRGSPSHDGLAARLAGWRAGDDGLTLELQPVRWSARLLEGAACEGLSVLCVARDADGRWLAGRRAPWVASWAGRWALGAGGSVEVGEDPVLTLARELEEEWSVRPDRLTVEALVHLPTGLHLLVGMARLAPAAEPVPDDEHDEWAWWPADVTAWPDEAHEPLRRMAQLLDTS